MSYSRTRWRDQSITAGAAVPFVTATGPLPPGFTPLQRIFNGAPPIWIAGLDRGLPTEPGSTLDFDTGPGIANFPYLLARDALFASDFEGDRKRPAANVALQWAPNDNSEYTFETFYQGFREEMFNNLHFTFADWWGTLGPNPARTITMYPDTNIIKTRVVGAPFGFNSGDSFDESTDTLRVCTERQMADRRAPHSRSRLFHPGKPVRNQFHRGAHGTRAGRRSRWISMPGDGIPSWHFTNPANGANLDADMLNPANWNVGQLFQNARQGSRQRPDLLARRRLRPRR